MYAILRSMDQDGSLNISFDEWRDFLLYAPSTTLRDIIEYWHHTTVSSSAPRYVWENLIASAVALNLNRFKVTGLCANASEYRPRPESTLTARSPSCARALVHILNR